MTLNNILLIIAALLPAAILCIVVYKKDRVEKEPIGLLALLLVLGVLICFPVIGISRFLGNVIYDIFEPYAKMIDGTLTLSGWKYYAYVAADNFISVALVEEGMKFLALFFATKDNKNFNCLFDGLIYSVFVSLGFAAYENVLYVFQGGFMTAFMRAIMSVPGHMFFGVIMGCYYSFWHIQASAQRLEGGLREKQFIPKGETKFKPNKYLVYAVLMPTLGHGFYDYCCTEGSLLSTFVLYVFVIFLYIYCFGRINKMSEADGSKKRYTLRLVLQKYPVLAKRFIKKDNKGDSENG